MDASCDHGNPVKLAPPGRFTRVSVQTLAGELEARLSEKGSWEVRVRRDQETTWRLACTGDLDCGAVTAQPAALLAEEAITRGPLTIDPAAHRATAGGSALALSRKEFALLLALARQPNRVFSKQELLESIWGYSGIARSRTIDSHACRLRAKLKAAGAGALIVNSHGVGYKLWDRGDLTTFSALHPAGETA